MILVIGCQTGIYHGLYMFIWYPLWSLWSLWFGLYIHNIWSILYIYGDMFHIIYGPFCITYKPHIMIMVCMTGCWLPSHLPPADCVFLTFPSHRMNPQQPMVTAAFFRPRGSVGAMLPQRPRCVVFTGHHRRTGHSFENRWFSCLRLPPNLA